MKHRPIVAQALAVLALAAALPALEQEFAAAGQNNPLALLGNGARPLAMGSAFTAVGGDLNSLYFNPAGLAALQGSHGEFHHHAWLGGINQETLTLGLGGRAASFGLSADYVNYGALEETDDFGNALGSFTPYDFTLGLTLARAFGRSGLSAGASLRGTQQSIKESGQLLSAADAGALWTPRGGSVSFGLTYSNLGPGAAGRSLAGALRLGLAWDLRLAEQYGILLASTLSGFSSGTQTLQFGAEGRLSRNLAARLGYQLSFMDQQFGGIAGLSAGLGARVGPLVMDYAFLPYGRAGSAHRVSVSYVFVDPAAPSAPPAAKAPVAHKAAPPPPRAADEDAVDLVFEVPAAGADTSEAQLRAAAEASPGDAAAWRALGAHYYRTRQKPKMLEAYGRALQLRPEDSPLRDWLEKAKQ